MLRVFTEDEENQLKHEQLQDLEAQIHSLQTIVTDVHHFVEDQATLLSSTEHLLVQIRDTTTHAESELVDAQQSLVNRGVWMSTIGVGLGAALGIMVPPIGLSIGMTVGGVGGFVWGRWA